MRLLIAIALNIDFYILSYEFSIQGVIIWDRIRFCTLIQDFSQFLFLSERGCELLMSLTAQRQTLPQKLRTLPP